MKQLISIASVGFLFGCTEDVHLETKTLATIGTETILYSAYQTGLDNYRIEIKYQNGLDTSVLFTSRINDAGFYSKTLTAKTKGDTLFIISRPPIELKSGKTIGGVHVLMIKPKE